MEGQGREVLPSKRGVFHPALLGALQKYVVLELFVARSTQKVAEAFSTQKVRHVSAAHVRGIEDVLIKKYVEHEMWVGKKLPGLAIPHSYLSPQDFHAAFDDAPNTPHLKLLLRPQDFLKVRGKPVDRLSEEDWESRCQAISKILSRRTTAINDVIAIAQGRHVEPAIEARYEPIFSLGKEDVLPIGTEHGSQLRETYLLIQLNASEVPRFEDHVRDKVLHDPRVRDVSKIEYTSIRPEPNKGGPFFEFLFRLKCTVFEADGMLESIQTWSDRTGVRIGTRTYDLWKYILRDSLQSLSDSISASERRLLTELFALDNRWKGVLHAEVRRKLASVIDRQVERLREAPTAERNTLQKWISEFYQYMCLFNFNATQENEQNYLGGCGSCWLSLYKYIEHGARQLLIKDLQLEDDAEIRHITAAIVARLNIQPIKESNLSNLIRLLAQHYDALRSQERSEFTTILRENLERVVPMRNDAGHDNMARWRKAISIAGHNWEARLRELESRGESMCLMIVAIARELDQRGLT